MTTEGRERERDKRRSSAALSGAFITTKRPLTTSLSKYSLASELADASSRKAARSPCRTGAKTVKELNAAVQRERLLVLITPSHTIVLKPTIVFRWQCFLPQQNIASPPTKYRNWFNEIFNVLNTLRICTYIALYPCQNETPLCDYVQLLLTKRSSALCRGSERHNRRMTNLSLSAARPKFPHPVVSHLRSIAQPCSASFDSN